MEFCDVDPLKILRHASTRWLSLQTTVTRTLHHWSSLQSYFTSHDDVEKEGKVKKIAAYLNDPEVKLYFLFLEFILVPLNEFNVAFQTKAAKIGILHMKIFRLLKKFMGKFVKTAVISTHTCTTTVPFDQEMNQHDDDKVAIGMSARTYLSSVADMEPSKIRNFFRSVGKFYMATTMKMLKKFIFKDTTLKDMAFLNPSFSHRLDTECVANLARRFPNIVDEGEVETLLEEFQDYQLASVEDLPDFDKNTDTVTFWAEMDKVELNYSATKRFSHLSTLAKACLVLPVSNAEVELFFRSELGNDTICSLLCCKQNTDVPCYNFEPSDSVLK